MDPNQHGYFFTKITGTIPLLDGSVQFFSYRVNGPEVSVEITCVFTRGK